MSRSGYGDYDCEPLELGRWRAMVGSATRGKRGQALFKDMLAALEAMPEKKLIASELVAKDGCVCALGAVAKHRGLDVSKVDPEDPETVADKFDIADCLAREIVYYNDEGSYTPETPEQRYERMVKWVKGRIKKVVEGDKAKMQL